MSAPNEGRSMVRQHLQSTDDVAPRSLSRLVNFLTYLDYTLIALALLLTCIGLAVLYGATSGNPYLATLAMKQAVFLGAAFGAMGLAAIIDYRWINRIGMALYVANIGALFFVLSMGQRINGARSWIDLGPINWQPSETMKIATVIVCAQWLSLRPEELTHWRSILVPGIICGIPAFLVLMQPDLGSASLFFLVFLGMMLIAGAGWGKLLTVIGAALMGMAAMFPLLKPYQKARLTSFLNPEADAQGRGYNVIQSKIAVGNGGFFGRGLGEGTQATHGFLPEHQTDFIFASAVEQLGFIGALIILLCYAFLLYKMICTIDKAKDRFGGLMVAGLVTIFFGHITENVGMTMGLLPVTGIPLPFLSYGGTFLVTTYISLGLVLNVASRRYTFVGV